MIAGRATAHGTQALAENSPEPASYSYGDGGLAISSIGLGTVRHAASDVLDTAYTAVVGRALELGCNLFDTALSYRFQRSERVIGAVLADRIANGSIHREAVVVATKGGYVAFDGAEPSEPDKWVHKTFIDAGLAKPHEFVSNYRHCFAPDFLNYSIAASRANLGLDTIDIYYLQNPETQRITLSHDSFRRRMTDAFETLEQAVEDGRIGNYGLSTWTGLRVAPKAPDYLSLAEMVGIAYEVAGNTHHFRYVQMPYNAMMPEAFAFENQQVGEAFLPPLAAAEELGLYSTVSAAIHQGRLSVPLVPQLPEYLPGLPSDAACALQFARSTPGVCAALLGTANVAHLEEDLSLLQRSPAEPAVIEALFRR
jgi:aryl-alcohol dehydrogenase-like predicted oxidoreductase